MGEGMVNVDVISSSSWQWWWLGGRTGKGTVSINIILSLSWWWLGRGWSGNDEHQPCLIVLFSLSQWLGGGMGEGTTSVNIDLSILSHHHYRWKDKH